MKVLLLCIAILLSSLHSFAADEICTPVLKTTKYKVQTGDHIAFILRKFNLEPVFGSFGSLNKLLKLNQIQNQNLIEPNDEIVIPFSCEEQIRPWMTIEKPDYRLITLVQNVKSEIAVPQAINIIPNVVGAEPQNNVITEDQKLNDILKPDGTAQKIDTEIENKTADEVSEALRYRMICEGEWTGSQCITRYSVLFAEGSGWFNRYDGTDPVAPSGSNNQGLLLSRFNPQIQLGWQNYWTENLKTELSAGVQNSEILPEAREIPIEQDKKVLSNIHLQARYEVGAFGFGVGIRSYDKLFYRFRFSGLSTPCLSNSPSFSGCGVFVHSANIISYFVNANWTFYQQGKFTYDTKLSFAYLGTGATGGFEVYNGSGIDLEMTVRHDRVHEYLYATLHYGISSQNTSIEVQKAQDLGFIFGYAWKLKDW
jgi:hypothetical protein